METFCYLNSALFVWFGSVTEAKVVFFNNCRIQHENPSVRSSFAFQSNFYQFGPVLKSLWVDPGVQAAFDRRNEFQLADSVKYFLDEIERIQNQR